MKILNTLKHALTGIALLVSMSASTPVIAVAADYTIRVVHLSNRNDEDYDGALVFKDYVEAQSNGAIAVELYPGGQLCGQPVECIEALQADIIQVFQTSTDGIANLFGEISVFDLPYLLSSDRVAECVLRGPLIDELRQAVLQKTGTLRLMTVGNTGGWRNFATTKKQIRKPADIEGLKIRTVSSPIQRQLVRAMGGNATPVAWPELYTSLATGVVDGSKNGITDIVAMKLHEYLKYITLDGHAYMTSFWWMNDKAYRQLPDDLKKIVLDGFDALSMTTIVLPKRRQIEAYKIFTDAGGVIYAPNAAEKAAFKEAAGGVYDWYRKQFGSHWLDAVNGAVASCKAQIEQSSKEQM